MKEVNVLRTELLAKVQANRAAHLATFEHAIDGYRQEVKAALNKWDNLLNHAATNNAADVHLAPQAVKAIGSLQAPKHFLADYDQALSMLEMSVDEQITLDVNEFRRLVLDDWGWKQDFVSHSSVYIR
ncbi:MAG TPA: hypothetical protein VN436_14335 [Holophaga sp.]|nr:hypothetical protein [Holophaga sp.]